MLKNKIFFHRNQDHIYIVSGGFKDYIDPVVALLGVRADHILANTFIYDENGQIKGYDHYNPLAHAEGKVYAVRSLKLKGNVLVVGDGYTDYEIKKAGVAHTFCAFTENVKRDSVIANADYCCANFYDVLTLIEK